MATGAVAAAIPANGVITSPSPMQAIAPSPTDVQTILGNTADLLKQVAELKNQVTALSAQVSGLTANQNTEAATVSDMAGRLQSTCWMLGYVGIQLKGVVRPNLLGLASPRCVPDFGQQPSLFSSKHKARRGDRAPSLSNFQPDKT